MTSRLILDIASKTGWVRSDAGKKYFGVFDCGGSFDRFQQWLWEMLRGADEVVIEAPFPAHGKTNFKTTRKLLGLVAIVELECARKGVPCVEVPVAHWRKWLIGRARAPQSIVKSRRRMWLKRAVIKACRRRGYNVIEDDAADALGLADYVAEQRG